MNSYNTIINELITQKQLLDEKGFAVNTANTYPSPSEITEAINSINFDLSDSTAIDVKAVKPNGNGGETTVSVSDDGIVAVMFDHEALGILKPERKVKTQYNGKGEYFNDFHKWTARYFNDFDENFVVFVVD